MFVGKSPTLSPRLKKIQINNKKSKPLAHCPSSQHFNFFGCFCAYFCGLFCCCCFYVVLLFVLWCVCVCVCVCGLIVVCFRFVCIFWFWGCVFVCFIIHLFGRGCGGRLLLLTIADLNFYFLTISNPQMMATDKYNRI